jgi:hypothetical protein
MKIAEQQPDDSTAKSITRRTLLQGASAAALVGMIGGKSFAHSTNSGIPSMPSTFGAADKSKSFPDKFLWVAVTSPSLRASVANPLYFSDKIRTQVRYMPPSLKDILLTVWRRTMVEHATSVKINDNTYPVKTTKGRGLKQVDFDFGGRSLRGLEQNPATKSRWAAMAREGKNIMQFLESDTYIAVVVDGKLRTYNARKHSDRGTS